MRRPAAVPPPAVAAMLLGSALAAGCIVVPQTREVYDPDCRIMRREVTLEPTVVSGFVGCSGDRDCAALLAAMGLVSAASLVVSGSVAIVGNAVYWFERQANCRRTEPPRS